MNAADRAELYNLYHLARTALDNPTRYERRLWAVREFMKAHPTRQTFRCGEDYTATRIYLEFERP
jgi:hypothetical protein